MPIDLSRPETFLFTMVHNGQTFAVRIAGADYEDARERFEAMTPRERKALVVARLSGGDRDHVKEIGTWILGLLRRAGRRAA